jgi:DNA-directed RNA polymerase sigma subunit (sigma70/sigma32)
MHSTEWAAIQAAWPTPRRRRLSAKEQDVLARVAGLDSQAAVPMTVIAAERGCTRENVRQVKEKAILKLLADSSP